MMTERKRKIMDALALALDYCGYDFNEVVSKKSRQRIFSDLRSIIWSIYQEETELPFRQVGMDFNWDRVTVYHAMARAKDFRKVDKNFADMYDSVYGAFLNAYSASQQTASLPVPTAKETLNLQAI